MQMDSVCQEARLESLRLELAASTEVVLLDHFRVPYQQLSEPVRDGIEELRVQPSGRVVLWPGGAWRLPTTAATICRGNGIPLFAGVLPDEAVSRILAAYEGEWSALAAIVGADGAPIASIWRNDDGSIFLPFDPNDVITTYWSERYLRHARGRGSRAVRGATMAAYYRLRPLLPRSLQIGLRRGFSSYQARTVFPGWPIETALHDFFDLMFAILAEVAGVPIPRIAPWPNGSEWALVLTHDVESADGLRAIDPIVELERSHGVRSCWNLVPDRYDVDQGLVDQLVQAGFEVGVHGFLHDGRDLESLARWQERLPLAHASAERWGAVGFRSAALHRNHEWMRTIRFDYDSSWPDTDPFEPQDGGCCTWLPHFNGELVELPVTMAQDHTLFVILRESDERVWTTKARFLREQGGLALLDTHPDYLVDQRIFRAYERLLDEFASDGTAWKALPREVSAWWRRRAASTIVQESGTWKITGPAASEGRVEFHQDVW